MIAGLGLDVVEVSRIERAMRHPRFLSRILTEREIEWLGDPTPSRVAGRWAAKEAIAKAVSTTLTWHDVEITTDSDGKPVAGWVRLPKGPEFRVHLSISHEKGVAAAVAIMERL